MEPEKRIADGSTVTFAKPILLKDMRDAGTGVEFLLTSGSNAFSLMPLTWVTGIRIDAVDRTSPGWESPNS